MSEFFLMSSLRGLTPNSSENEARDICRWTTEWQVETALGIAVPHAERTQCIVKRKSRLVGAKLSAGAAITANATNFLTIIVRKRLAATAAATVLLTLALDTPVTDDVAAWINKDLFGLAAYVTGTAPDFDFADGDMVTVEVTKTAAGLVLPVCVLELTFEPRT